MTCCFVKLRSMPIGEKSTIYSQTPDLLQMYWGPVGGDDMREEDVRDFFVSYTQSDRAWAEWLAWELEVAGYTVRLQSWDMPAGSSFVHEMDQALHHTRHTLIVLSPAYLRSQ